MLLLAAALSFGLGADAPAQTPKRPDFSGKWLLKETTRSSPNLNGLVGGGKEIAIVQTAQDFSINRTWGREQRDGKGRISLSVRLDGTTSVHKVPELNPENLTKRTSTASWDGAQLVIVTTVSRQRKGGPEAATKTTEVVTLEGSLLVVRRFELQRGDLRTLAVEKYSKLSR